MYTPDAHAAPYLSGFAAIRYCEANDVLPAKFADPIEGHRWDIPLDEAREIASEDPGLIYIDLSGEAAE